MEYSAFEEATVPVCCFMIKNAKTEPVGNYLKLSDFKGGMTVQKEKVLQAIQDNSAEYFYQTNQRNFIKIPGSPISFWISKNLINDFIIGARLDKIVAPKQGLATTDNNRFLRQWFEVDYSKIEFTAESKIDAMRSGYKWFPFNKGGAFRKWYGNNDYIVNYENDGTEIKENVLRKYPYLKTPDFVVKNSSYYFKEAITYSAITSGKSSYRVQNSGMVFDHAAYNMYVSDMYLLAFLNSIVSESISKMLNPTINAGSTYIGSLPIIKQDNSYIENIVKNNIRISKNDWNNKENSWDFKKGPLI